MSVAPSCRPTANRKALSVRWSATRQPSRPAGDGLLGHPARGDRDEYGGADTAEGRRRRGGFRLAAVRLAYVERAMPVWRRSDPLHRGVASHPYVARTALHRAL